MNEAEDDQGNEPGETEQDHRLHDVGAPTEAAAQGTAVRATGTGTLKRVAHPNRVFLGEARAPSKRGLSS